MPRAIRGKTSSQYRSILNDELNMGVEDTQTGFKCGNEMSPSDDLSLEDGTVRFAVSSTHSCGLEAET
jgi:hypothetical protein